MNEKAIEGLTATLQGQNAGMVIIAIIVLATTAGVVLFMWKLAPLIKTSIDGWVELLKLTISQSLGQIAEAIGRTADAQEQTNHKLEQLAIAQQHCNEAVTQLALISSINKPRKETTNNVKAIIRHSRQ